MVTGKCRRNGKIETDGRTSQDVSAGRRPVGAISIGGGWVSSMSSVAKRRKICRRPLDRSIPIRLITIRDIDNVERIFFRASFGPPSIVMWASPSTVAPPTKTGADKISSASIRGW